MADQTPLLRYLPNWSRIHLFYTLFTVIGHFLFGLEGLKASLRTKISKNSIGKLRVQLDEISVKYDEVSSDMENPDAPNDYKTFVDYSRRRTTDTTARIYRAEFVCRKLKKVLA